MNIDTILELTDSEIGEIHQRLLHWRIERSCMWRLSNAKGPR